MSALAGDITYWSGVALEGVSGVCFWRASCVNKEKLGTCLIFLLERMYNTNGNFGGGASVVRNICFQTFLLPIENKKI